MDKRQQGVFNAQNSQGPSSDLHKVATRRVEISSPSAEQTSWWNVSWASSWLCALSRVWAKRPIWCCCSSCRSRTASPDLFSKHLCFPSTLLMFTLVFGSPRYDLSGFLYLDRSRPSSRPASLLSEFSILLCLSMQWKFICFKIHNCWELNCTTCDTE